MPTTGTVPQGSQSRLWIATTLPFNATTALCLEFTGEGMSQTKERYYNDAIRGTRSRARERMRTVRAILSGSITMTPSYTELRTLLPLICGTAESGAGTSGDKYTYALAETIPSFYLLIAKVPPSDTSHTKGVQLCEGCVVSRATFSSNSGGPLVLTLDIEGTREKMFQHGALSTASDGLTDVMSLGSSAQSVPSSVPGTESCWVFADSQATNGTFTIGGTNHEAFDFSLSIDNVVDANRFANSLYRRVIPAQDRDVQMSATLPFTTAEDELYDLAVNSSSPDINNNLLTFEQAESSSSDTISFNLGTWNPTPRTPVVAGKFENPLQLSGGVYRKNTTTAKPELAITMWKP